MRSGTFAKVMTRLALLAMLLLMLAPTVSRSLQAGTVMANPIQGIGQTSASVAGPMCTTAGLRTTLVPGTSAAILGADGQRAPVPQDPHDAGDACGYCSIVTPLPVLVLLAFAVVQPTPLAPEFRVHMFAPRVLRNLRGLGAQAPPLPL